MDFERDSRKLEKMLSNDGFIRIASGHTSSHAKWKKDQRVVTVPRSKEIKSWTIKGIYRDAGWL